MRKSMRLIGECSHEHRRRRFSARPGRLGAGPRGCHRRFAGRRAFRPAEIRLAHGAAVHPPPRAATLARHYLRSAAIPGCERGVPYTIAVADDAAGRYARHEELAALRIAIELIEPHDERTITILRRTAVAAVLAVIDPDDQLAAAEAAAVLIAEEEGADAACDFVVDLLVSARHLEDITTCWRLASLARRWLSPDRRDRAWAYVRDTELSERNFHDPLAPGIPTGDDDYRELRAVIATLAPEEESDFVITSGPGSRAEAEARLARNPRHIPSAWASGNVRRCLRAIDEMIDLQHEERTVGAEATSLAFRARFEALIGDFDASAASLAAAVSLLSRVPPESNAVMQVLGAPMLIDLLRGVEVTPEAMDAIIDFADRPEYAVGRARLAACRCPRECRAGNETVALDLLEQQLVAVDRARRVGGQRPTRVHLCRRRAVGPRTYRPPRHTRAHRSRKVARTRPLLPGHRLAIVVRRWCVGSTDASTTHATGSRSHGGCCCSKSRSP